MKSISGGSFANATVCNSLRRIWVAPINIVNVKEFMADLKSGRAACDAQVAIAVDFGVPQAVEHLVDGAVDLGLVV